VTGLQVLFREVFLGKQTTTTVAAASHVTRPCDVLPRLLNDIDIDYDLKKKVRILCTKLAKILEPCVPLMSKTPTSIAAVIIARTVGNAVTKKDICAACKISVRRLLPRQQTSGTLTYSLPQVPTMNKIDGLVKTYLESIVK